MSAGPPARTPPRAIAGKYELLEVAGQGGMATVWRGVMHGAAGFSRPVAIKQVLPRFSHNQEFVAMFVEEARVGSQLQHPNIVQIVDFEEEGGSYYLVMEWVEGLDLGRYLEALEQAGQVAPWPIVVAVVIEALRGLCAAHERIDSSGTISPVIHRDIAPQNILIGVSGVVKLSDFGLARAMDRSRMTRPDVIKGKLRYLAPELTQGNPVSAQSDLFGMGVVLWEALAGRSLYQGENDLEIFKLARQAEIPALSTVRDDLPEELTDIVGRTLSREPERRYASAREMLRQLMRMLRRITQFTDAFTIAESIQRARQLLVK